MQTLRSRYARRVFVPVMAVSLLSACVRWEPHRFDPAQLVLEKGLVRLTMLNGDKIELADPTVSDGEVVGHPAQYYVGPNWTAIRSDTLRVPTDSVDYTEIRVANPNGTRVLVIATLGVLITAVAAVREALSNIGCGS